MVSNPVYDPYQILYKVYGEKAHLKQAIADTYIEEQYRGRTVKICYGVLENNDYLDFCLRHYAQKSPKLAVRILIKIALYMLLFMDKKKYMVTDCTVEICKKLGKSGVSGFVNAFLRRFDKAEVDKALPKGEAGEAISLSYPLPFYKRLKREYGDRARQIAAAKSAGVSVRFVSKEAAEKYADRQGLKTPFENNYVYENFVRDEGYDEGEYTFQSVGSIAICDCVSPCQNLLDACAAPGGKSVLLSKKCERVTSCELHDHRVGLIEQYFARMGVKNATAMQRDSSVFCPDFEGKFDAVLCDVPCSGYGTVTENPDVKLFRAEEDMKGLQTAQESILNTCAKYVQKGGALYYSTCAIFEEENDGRIAAFLETNSGFEVEKIDSPLAHDKKKFGLQFLPDTAYGAGFYVCKLRRIK
ncbi:MAG: hypothetical protein IJY11_03485 [Clostridia bacterium]|nr:hypothetical protein [Clostridia bacterium]